MSRFVTLGLSVSLPLLTAGCVLLPSDPAKASGPASSPAPSPSAAADAAAGARVGEAWQKHLLTQLDKLKLDEAWGLFSEGGWSDAGQVMVLANRDRTTLRLAIVQPNRKEVGVERDLTPAELKSLMAVTTKAPTLADVDMRVFDALVYEYVHIRRDAVGAEAKVIDRLYIKSSGSQPLPDHEALIQAFQALKPLRK